jgi:hypothetical protein
MIEYINRLGDKYYLLQGKTKTGKPKYYVSRKTKGIPAESMPDGFEFYENPERGLVSFRKVRPSPVLPIERQTIERAARQAGVDYFLVDVQEGSLVVYTPGEDPAQTVEMYRKLLGPFAESQKEWLAQRAYYMPMFALPSSMRNAGCSMPSAGVIAAASTAGGPSTTVGPWRSWPRSICRTSTSKASST